MSLQTSSWEIFLFKAIPAKIANADFISHFLKLSFHNLPIFIMPVVSDSI
jgi:hypothetical protein